VVLHYAYLPGLSQNEQYAVLDALLDHFGLVSWAGDQSDEDRALWLNWADHRPTCAYRFDSETETAEKIEPGSYDPAETPISGSSCAGDPQPGGFTGCSRTDYQYGGTQ
jgi:hypothetical protein